MNTATSVMNQVKDIVWTALTIEYMYGQHGSARVQLQGDCPRVIQCKRDPLLGRVVLAKYLFADGSVLIYGWNAQEGPVYAAVGSVMEAVR